MGHYVHRNDALTCDPPTHNAGYRPREDDAGHDFEVRPLAEGNTLMRLPAGVLFGCTVAGCNVTNTFNPPFSANVVRVYPTGDRRAAPIGLRCELYATDNHIANPSRFMAGTECVPLWIVDWDAAFEKTPTANDAALSRLIGITSARNPMTSQAGADGVAESNNTQASRFLALSQKQATTRRQLVTDELALLDEINELEARAFRDGDVNTGQLVMLSALLPDLYARWCKLLRECGPEREGDVAVAIARLLTYLVGELEVRQRANAVGPADLRDSLKRICPLLFNLTSSNAAVEPLLRRIHALYEASGDDSDIGPFFFKVARWVGRRSPTLPYLMTVLPGAIDRSVASQGLKAGASVGGFGGPEISPPPGARVISRTSSGTTTGVGSNVFSPCLSFGAGGPGGAPAPLPPRCYTKDDLLKLCRDFYDPAIAAAKALPLSDLGEVSATDDKHTRFSFLVHTHNLFKHIAEEQLISLQTPREEREVIEQRVGGAAAPAAAAGGAGGSGHTSFNGTLSSRPADARSVRN